MLRLWSQIPPRFICLFIAAASADLLMIALAFEHIGGYLPCSLCIAQRWPHLFIILFGLVGFVFHQPKQHLALQGALAFAIAGIALYHVGVEQAWWAGPSGCSADMATSDLASLTDALLAAPMVKCDEIAWSFLGLSMAAWHMLASLSLAGLAGFGFIKAQRQAA